MTPITTLSLWSGDLNNLICIGLLLDNIFEQMTQITVPVEDMSLHLEPAENVRIPEDWRLLSYDGDHYLK